VKRVPLKRTTVLISRKPLPRFSAKRSREQRTYSALRQAFLENNPTCAWPDCSELATTVQHSAGRVGERYLDVLTWRPSCWHHNAWAEDHPLEARAAGFSVARLAVR